MDASNIHPSRREVYEPWISPPHGQLGHDQDFVVQSYARLLDRVTNENKTLAAKAKELEESANDVEDEKAELQKEHDTYFARVAGYEELIGVLWARIPADEQGSDMPAELVNDEQLCRSAKDFLNNLVSVNEAQKEELAELRKHYAVANTEKTKAMESEARLQREVRRMRGEAEEHQRGHEEALQVARERDEFRRSCAALQAQVNALNTTKQQLEGRVAELSTANDQLENENAQRRAERGEYVPYRRLFIALNARLNEEKSHLTAELQAARATQASDADDGDAGSEAESDDDDSAYTAPEAANMNTPSVLEPGVLSRKFFLCLQALSTLASATIDAYAWAATDTGIEAPQMRFLQREGYLLARLEWSLKRGLPEDSDLVRTVSGCLGMIVGPLQDGNDVKPLSAAKRQAREQALTIFNQAAATVCEEVERDEKIVAHWEEGLKFALPNHEEIHDCMVM